MGRPNVNGSSGLEMISELSEQFSEQRSALTKAGFEKGWGRTPARQTVAEIIGDWKPEKEASRPRTSNN